MILRQGTRRGLFALLLSLALHLAILLGVSVKQGGGQGPSSPPGPLQMRIVASTPVVEKSAPQSAAAVPAPVVTQAAEVRSTQAAARQETAEQAARPAAPAQSQTESAQSASSVLPAMNVPLVEDPVYYPAKQLDVLPAARQHIMPEYPDEAVQHNINGSVKLLLLIDATGLVVDVSVVEATPPGYFEDAAVKAFKNAKFTPAEKNGKKVRSRVMIQVSFDLVPPAPTLLH